MKYLHSSVAILTLALVAACAKNEESKQAAPVQQCSVETATAYETLEEICQGDDDSQLAAMTCIDRTEAFRKKFPGVSCAMTTTSKTAILLNEDRLKLITQPSRDKRPHHRAPIVGNCSLEDQMADINITENCGLVQSLVGAKKCVAAHRAARELSPTLDCTTSTGIHLNYQEQEKLVIDSREAIADYRYGLECPKLVSESLLMLRLNCARNPQGEVCGARVDGLLWNWPGVNCRASDIQGLDRLITEKYLKSLK